MRRAFILICSLLGAGAQLCCTTDPPPGSLSPGERVTIFVPGYRGSFLSSNQDPHAWLTVGAALVPGRLSLALHFPGEREGPTLEPLVPEGPLTEFVLIPWVIRQEIYLSWLRFGATQLPGFISFGYDWRTDIRQAASQLCSLIDHLVSEEPNRRIDLVAHSMGGLVVLHCLRYGKGPVTEVPSWAGSSHVDHVVFAGVPFGGAPGNFDDLFVGTRTGFNRALMSREALFTFASAYQLLPPQGDYFVDRTGTPITLEAYRPESWWEQGWGIFSDPTLRGNPSYQSQQRKLLMAHQELATALANKNGPVPNFQVLTIVGHGRATDAAVRTLSQPGTPINFDFNHPLKADGDGSVVATRTLPPTPLFTRIVNCGTSHVRLLNEPDTQKEIADFLLPKSRN